MKRAAALALMLALGSVGCGSKNPNGPGNQPTVFNVQLRASNETPPITNTESNASGTAVITINTVRDSSGNVTSGTIDFNVSLAGFPNGSSAILAHIHNAPVGVPGGVFVNTGLSAGAAIQMPNGSATFSFTGIDPGVDKINQILANPSGFYFNVHSPVNPTGAVRGQLQ